MKQNLLNKEQVKEELKNLIEVAESTLDSDVPLSFQLAITTISNGRGVHKKTVVKALKAMQAFHSQAAREWLFSPEIMVRSEDTAGQAMQEALSARQAAKAAIIQSASKLKGAVSGAKK